MNNNIDLKEVKKQLPYGSIANIAKRSGIDRNSIVRAFNGEKRPNYPEALKAIAEYYGEYKAKEKAALQAMTEAMEAPEQLTERLNCQREKYGENSSPTA